MCCIVTGPDPTRGAELAVIANDEEEMQEEVAEAVQAARKERLRDDLLGMVCPSDWTIEAPEPAGIATAVCSLLQFQVPCTCGLACNIKGTRLTS